MVSDISPFLLAVLLCCAHVAGVAAQERIPALDIDVSAETNQMYGIWSDGTTMWVADWYEKLYQPVEEACSLSPAVQAAWR